MKDKIIYLHGFASGPGSYKAGYFRALLEAAGRRVEVPDLARGDFENLTLTGQLQVIEQTAAGEPCVLMGSSMGGYLAALFAARHPEVRQVVMMAPAFGFARRWVDSLGPERLEAWKRTGYLEVFHYGEKRMRRLAYTLIADGQPYEDYPEVTQPALVFHGRRDDVVPVAFSEEFAARRPNAQLVTFDSGHELLDALEPMGGRVTAFLNPSAPET